MSDMEAKIAAELHVPSVNVCMVGSTLICGYGNDIDLLCLVPSDECLEKAGFKPDVERLYESALKSWRRDNINIIAVHDRAFFLTEVAIAYAAKVVHEIPLDMRHRHDRIAFHSQVRDIVLSRISAGVDEFDFLDI